jgi:DNA invertase Pin-like site-specific DNA recombinase
MMGMFAEFERSMIQERVRAGLARARRGGKRLGGLPDPGTNPGGSISEHLDDITRNINNVAARLDGK